MNITGTELVALNLWNSQNISNKNGRTENLSGKESNIIQSHELSQALILMTTVQKKKVSHPFFVLFPATKHANNSVFGNTLFTRLSSRPVAPCHPPAAMQPTADKCHWIKFALLLQLFNVSFISQGKFHHRYEISNHWARTHDRVFNSWKTWKTNLILKFQF
jgi:hypothetical protein